jgi:hypothetical protein
MNIVFKIIIAIVALLVINMFVQPLLISVLPPFGLILVVALYVGLVAWLIGLI